MSYVVQGGILMISLASRVFPHGLVCHSAHYCITSPSTLDPVVDGTELTFPETSGEVAKTSSQQWRRVVQDLQPRLIA